MRRIATIVFIILWSLYIIRVPREAVLEISCEVRSRKHCSGNIRRGQPKMSAQSRGLKEKSFCSWSFYGQPLQLAMIEVVGVSSGGGQEDPTKESVPESSAVIERLQDIRTLAPPPRTTRGTILGRKPTRTILRNKLSINPPMGP